MDCGGFDGGDAGIAFFFMGGGQGADR